MSLRESSFDSQASLCANRALRPQVRWKRIDMSGSRRLAIIIILTVAALLFVATHRLLPLLSVVAGFKAGHMCSAVFLAGRDPGEVLEHELRADNFRSRLAPDPVVERSSASVLVQLLFGWMERRAVYRGSLGCTLLPPGWSLEQTARLPTAEMPTPLGDPAVIPWPDGDVLADRREDRLREDRPKDGRRTPVRA